MLLTGLPFASVAVQPYSCRNGAFPSYTDLSLAEIVAGKDDRVHARDDMEGCPEQAKCLQKGYLVSGDKVLTAHPTEGWICIYYPGRKSDYTGWVPLENIKAVPLSATPGLDEWEGLWIFGGADRVSIDPAPTGTLKISGNAKWYGGKDTFGHPIVHFGEVNGEAKPTANKVVVKEGDDEYACVVSFELIGPYLVSTDNGNCGGVNVRFNGVYLRDRHE
jgi:hypothetical protein